VIDKADTLRASGQTNAAMAKYKLAQAALLNFKARNPRYDTKAVAYRLNEVSDRLEPKLLIKETPAKAPAPAPKKTPAKNEGEPSATGKSQVKLLERGAEPRKPLRLHVKAGDKQNALVTIKLNVDIPGAPPGAAPKIPTITVPADISIQKVETNGDITADIV